MTLSFRLVVPCLFALGCASAAPAAADEAVDLDGGGAGGDGAGVGGAGAGGDGGAAGSGEGFGGGSAAGFPSSTGGKSAAGGGAPGAGGAATGLGGAAAAGPGGASAQGGTGGGKGGASAAGGASGAGGSAGTGGASGSAGAGASTAACATPVDSCNAPTALGMVSGDTGGGSVMGSGMASTWFRVRVTEDDNSVFGVKVRVKLVLSAPATSNYDLYAYVDTAADVPSCTSPAGMSTNASGPDAVSLKWGEGSLANGSDDSRWVSAEVRWVSGGCEPFTLVATGNQ